MRITASDVYAALSGAQCDRRVYLEAHDVEGSPPSLLDEMLWGLGAEHEKNHLRLLPDALDLSRGSTDEKLEATRRALDAGTPAIYQPLFRSMVMINGISCEIVGQPDFVLARRDRHVIRDTKAATRVDERERPDIAGQLRLYGWLYEQTTGQPPKALEILNGSDELHEIEYRGWHQLKPTLQRIVALKTASSEPHCWVKASNRSCPYFERCWSEAIDRQDVGTVPGMIGDLAERLHDDGVASIADLVRSHTAESLAEIEVTIGDNQQRVGQRAERIRRSADSLLSDKVIQFAPLNLPTTDHVVMFDLEGVPALAGGDGLIYLWGTEVKGPMPAPYLAVFAEAGPDPGQRGWQAFLDRAAALFQTYGSDLPFVHWASYERTQILNHISRYGDPDQIAARVLDNLVDLLQIVRNSLVLPVHSYSLKAIEKYVGFERSQAEYGGAWSIAIWEEAAACEDPAERDALLEQLATYNREDCEATWAVYEWLSNFAK